MKELYDDKDVQSPRAPTVPEEPNAPDDLPEYRAWQYARLRVRSRRSHKMACAIRGLLRALYEQEPVVPLTPVEEESSPTHTAFTAESQAFV